MQEDTLNAKQGKQKKLIQSQKCDKKALAEAMFGDNKENK